MYATQGGFETSLPIEGPLVLEQLESWVGTRPRAIVVRDRSPRGRELSEAAVAREVAVIDTYSYPQLAAPRGPAEETRRR